MNGPQLARNAAADAVRAAIAMEGVLTYNGLEDAELRLIRAIESLREARKALREAAKPIRAIEAARRRSIKPKRTLFRQDTAYQGVAG